VTHRADHDLERGGHHFRWSAALGVVLAVAAVVLLWSGWRGLGLQHPAARVAAGAGGDASAPPYLLEPVVHIGAVQRTRPERSPAAGQPVRLVVPRLHVDAPVLPITAPGRVLLPPSDPQELGWWRDGAVPGAAHGGALITGHTVHTGGGAFDDLETLRAGDPVTVRTTKGRVRYEVTGVTVYRKARLARDAARVFRQSGPGRLVLITCEDWNGVTYLSNAVVFADPV
jgi:LPXTG-site transpeptidase (sortase) family protein